MANLVTLSDPRSPAAEAYRTLRTNLMFSNLDENLRLLAVSSPSVDEGKSIALANLAVTLAQSDHQTLIVDADLRRPTQQDIWNISEKRGLTDMLLDNAVLDSPPIVASSVENLGILPSGSLPANPADVLASAKMDKALERLSEIADYVLFDVPPILAVTDAAILGRRLDGLVMIVRAGKTRREKIVQAQKQLERVGVNLVGVALTNAQKTNKQVYG